MALSLAQKPLHFGTNARREKYYWSTIGRQLLSRTVFSFFSSAIILQIADVFLRVVFLLLLPCFSYYFP